MAEKHKTCGRVLWRRTDSSTDREGDDWLFYRFQDDTIETRYTSNVVRWECGEAWRTQERVQNERGVQEAPICDECAFKAGLKW